jgi:hypothetical protein
MKKWENKRFIWFFMLKMSVKTGICILFFFAQIDEINAKDYKYIDSIMRICPAQNTRSAENIAKYIAGKFSSNADRLRAAYSWVAQHISYDVEKMYTGVTYKEESEVVGQTLKSRKTVCSGYVMTFKAIAEKLGLQIVTVTGYTKQNGQVDEMSHAWAAVKYNGEWRLIDPTWSAGYVQSGAYHKRFTDKWFLVKPDKIIKSHIPFDPVLQFSYFPLNGNEFLLGKSADSVTARFYSFPDTLKIIGKLTEKERLIAENRRIRSMGIANSSVRKHIEHNKKQLDYLEHNEMVDRYNEAADLYNVAVSLFNKQSANGRKTAKSKLDKAAELIDMIQNPDKELGASIRELKEMISELKSQIEKRL